MWAIVPAAILEVAVVRHRPYPMMMAWTAVILTICLAPIVIWAFDLAFSGRTKKPPGRHAKGRSSDGSADLNLTSATS
jgi:hypothetical protein